MTLIVVTDSEAWMIDVAERPPVSANRVGARCCPVFSGRLPREFPENAIELRQRLKAHVERNLTYAQIDIAQSARAFSIRRRLLFEFFAQIIWTNFD